MDFIKTIRLKKFKKFEDLTLTVTDKNVLAGANNSGKTTVLNAIRLFFLVGQNHFSGKPEKILFHKRFLKIDDLIPISSPDELWSNKGKSSQKNLSIEVEFTSRLKLEILFSYNFGQVHVHGNVIENPGSLTGSEVNAAIAHKNVFIPGLVGILPHEPYVTPARRMALTKEARYAEMYRSSLYHLIQSDDKALGAINALLDKYFNITITKAEFDPEKDIVVDIRYKHSGSDADLDIVNAGAGMQQIIQMLVYMHFNKPDLLLIDEPDAHLHPDLQAKLGEIINDVTSELNTQLFLSTHSPEVLDSFKLSNILVIKNNSSKIKPLETNNINMADELYNAGIVSNSFLTRIAVQPFAVVVEDENSSIIEKFDELCNANLFVRKGALIKAKGMSRFELVRDLGMMLTDVVSRKIRLIFIRDRDGLPDEYSSAYDEYLKERHIHVITLERHEIENYLIDPDNLKRTVDMVKAGNGFTVEKLEEMLLECANAIKYSAAYEVRQRAQTIMNITGFKKWTKNEEVIIDQWFQGLTVDLTNVLKYYPGKGLIHEITDRLKDEHDIQISISKLMRTLNKDSLPADIEAIFAKLSKEKQSISGKREFKKRMLFPEAGQSQ